MRRGAHDKEDEHHGLQMKGHLVAAGARSGGWFFRGLSSAGLREDHGHFPIDSQNAVTPNEQKQGPVRVFLTPRSSNGRSRRCSTDHHGLDANARSCERAEERKNTPHTRKKTCIGAARWKVRR